MWCSSPSCIAEFQPTLPARGATSRVPLARDSKNNFNPRSPHGERLQEVQKHLPSELFQPTLPARGATRRCARGASWSNFNPRSPHGERLQPSMLNASLIYFNPRSPHGERRPRTACFPLRTPISTHAPRTGSDRQRTGHGALRHHFNPRSPHGERQSQQPVELHLSYFNPRSPHGERP